MNLKDSVVLVTAGSRRVGAAVVEGLADQGARVAIHYFSSSLEAEALKRSLQERGGVCELFQADLTDPSSVAQLFCQIDGSLGTLTALIHNVGAFERAPLSETTPELWLRMQSLNLFSAFLCAKEATSRLRQRRGAMVFIGDLAGVRGYANHSAYSAARAGLVGLAKSLALELAPLVRVNVVAPGIVMWPEDASWPQADPDALGLREAVLAQRQRLTARIPLARIGTPEEVASSVRFLLEQDFMTGQVLCLDGGRSLM